MGQATCEDDIVRGDNISFEIASLDLPGIHKSIYTLLSMQASYINRN